jgi:hypothetical protein
MLLCALLHLLSPLELLSFSITSPLLKPLRLGMEVRTYTTTCDWRQNIYISTLMSMVTRPGPFRCNAVDLEAAFSRAVENPCRLAKPHAQPATSRTFRTIQAPSLRLEAPYYDRNVSSAPCPDGQIIYVVLPMKARSGRGTMLAGGIYMQSLAQVVYGDRLAWYKRADMASPSLL